MGWDNLRDVGGLAGVAALLGVVVNAGLEWFKHRKDADARDHEIVVHDKGHNVKTAIASVDLVRHVEELMTEYSTKMDGLRSELQSTKDRLSDTEWELGQANRKLARAEARIAELERLNNGN